MNGLIKKGVGLLVCVLIITQITLNMAVLSSRTSELHSRDLQHITIERTKASVLYPDAFFSSLLNLTESDPNRNDFEPTMESTYFALRSLSLLNKTSQLNAMYPNFAFNYIMNRFNGSTQWFSEPINRYESNDSNYKLTGCGHPLTNAYAILALNELNRLGALNDSQKNSILNVFLTAQNSNGSFGLGDNRTSRASDTYFILTAIMKLNPMALSEEQINLTKSWLKNKQQLNTAYGNQGGFPQPTQFSLDFAYLYETAFSLRIAAMLNFSDFNFPYLYHYINKVYEPGTGFVYNFQPYSYPNERENALNIIHTTSALFYLSVSELNISGSWNSNAFISYLLGTLNSEGKWMTGIQGGKIQRYHSIETYWLGLELLARYNRISELSPTIKDTLFWNIMNFSNVDSTTIAFSMLDYTEESLSKYILSHLYRLAFEAATESEKETIYQTLKAHYNPSYNSFAEMRIAESFLQMRVNSYFLPTELRGFRLDTISGFIYHPRTTYLAVKLLDCIGFLDRFIAEPGSNIAQFTDPTYVSTLVNINESYSTLGGMFVFSASGNRLSVLRFNEWISADITYYHLKTIEFLSKYRSIPMSQIINQTLASLISTYARLTFPNLDQQSETLKTLKLWEVLTILNTTLLTERTMIKNFVQAALYAPSDKSLQQIAAANSLYPFYASEIAIPSQLNEIRNRIQQLMNQELIQGSTSETIETIIRILDIHFFEAKTEIPDVLTLGYPFEATMRIETIALQNAFIRNVSMVLNIENQSYNMQYLQNSSYQVSTPIYQNISASEIQIRVSGTINGTTAINLTKWVKVSAHISIRMQVPEQKGNGSKWIREGTQLKGVFYINVSYRNYADQDFPFYDFTESFEAFESVSGQIIGSTSLITTRQTIQNVVSSTIEVEIPIGSINEIKIRFTMNFTSLENASIQKPEFLKFSNEKNTLIYEAVVKVNDIEQSRKNEDSFWMPELSLSILLGIGVSGGIVIFITNIKNIPTKKRTIDVEPTLND